jgi:hypothetical protein
MHEIITERRVDCYAKYLIHGIMQNIMHDTITKYHADCYAKYLYWVSCRRLCMILLQNIMQNSNATCNIE